MTTIEDFTSQYGLVQKIDAFGYMKYLAENPDAPRKHGKVVLVTADTPLKASRGRRQDHHDHRPDRRSEQARH